MATQGLTVDEQKAVEEFKKTVVEPSMNNLVILDFWAEWCGPCKALAPVLESIAAQYADKGVVLKKINVDENRFIAAQFQVQSIPTVYALFQGQPVADLTQARTESQLKQIIDQILAKLPIGGGQDGGGQNPQEQIGPLIAMGEDVLAGGDGERALGIFSQIKDMDPDSIEAESGLIRALALLGRGDEAQARLDAIPADKADDPAVERAKAALAIAAESADPEELAALKARVEKDDGDFEARYELAGALIGARDYDGAAQQLLHIIAAEREWNEGAARQKLLDLFEAVGLEDPWVVATRRKLSEILFG